MHLFGSIRGEYKVCCFAEYAPDSPILGTSDDEINSVWNGEPLKQIRSDFLQGNSIPACEHACYSKEKLGGQSHRQIMNNNYKHLQYLQEKTNSDGSIENYPSYLDVRFGNTCNFRCRMCGPHSSTSWYKEMPSELKYPLDSYTNSSVFWKNIDKIAPSIQDIYFAGGEPFVQEGHYKLLEYMIKNSFSNKISLSYNTNLSYKKFKKFNLKNLWSSFKSVKLWPSCEGYGERVDYSRKGFSWQKFEDNIDYYKEYIQTISAVISIYSISTMPEMLLWSKNKGINIHGTILIDPAYMSVTCLPLATKKAINHKFKNFLLENYKLFTKHEIEMIKSWITYMNSQNNSHLLDKFKNFNTKYDLSRNENFESVFPEYASWYKNI